jgi:hypothetical protein
MPRTINEGFVDFLAWLTPTSTESDAAKRHRASIEACLKNNFDLQRFFRTGSFGNGTSISRYSDVDYFASTPRKHLKQDSGTTLTQVRNALDNRFPFTNVRVNCPAVKVPFGTLAKETTEVVPADYVGATTSGYSIYEIPDCSGGWMRSSPEAHNAYVRAIDQQLGAKVKPLIRFIKAWKFYREVPVSSFYLELRVAEYAASKTSIVYGTDVNRIFAYLSSKGLAAMRDPLGISGLIQPCSTNIKLFDAKSKLSTVLKRAENAVDASSRGNIENAFYWWKLVFGEFPSYYR